MWINFKLDQNKSWDRLLHKHWLVCSDIKRSRLCLRLCSAPKGLLGARRPTEVWPPLWLPLACLLLGAGKIMTVVQHARSQAAPTVKPLAFPKGSRGKQSFLLTPSHFMARNSNFLFWKWNFPTSAGLICTGMRIRFVPTCKKWFLNSDCLLEDSNLSVSFQFPLVLSQRTTQRFSEVQINQPEKALPWPVVGGVVVISLISNCIKVNELQTDHQEVGKNPNCNPDFPVTCNYSACEKWLDFISQAEAKGMREQSLRTLCFLKQERNRTVVLSVILDTLKMCLLAFAYKSITDFGSACYEAGRFPGLLPEGYQGYISSYAEPDRKVISFVWG